MNDFPSMPSKMLLLIGGDSEIGAATAGLLKGQGMPVVVTTRRSDRLADDVKLLEGVAKVDRTGVRNEVIYIETDEGSFLRCH